VYLEIYLLEASVGRELKTGAGGHFAFPFNTSQGAGVGLIASAPSADVSSLVLSPSALQGLAGGVLGPLLGGSGQLLGTGADIPAFGVVIQAIQSNEDVNIVAEPHIYTADNKEAQIEVGRKVPTPGALQFGGGAGGSSLTPLQSINREDVTLDIKVTPHVKDEVSLTLDIELEDRDVVSQDPTLGVTTTKRRIKLENVLARDDLPVVLGGLMREREIENTEQVPGLGSIPILGWFFKRRVKKKEKVNLLIILIPHVVETADDIRRIHERRTRERYEFLERETSFKRRELATNVNYRKKAGLLANIDREARRLESEELLLRQAEQELASERITGEIGLSPRVDEVAQPVGDRPRPRPEASPIPASPAGTSK
jgi:general secretion pathway protein D